MIGKVLRGERPAGLIYYLYGPGRHEEHTDPHIVAGWRHPAELEPPLRPDGRRDFRHLNGLLQQTLAALGDRAPGRPVWHCVARAAPTDRMLSDDEWAQVAGEIMHRTGLASCGEEDDAVRWVAIRHGPDHIHIVATLARQDGGRPRVSNDYYRVREACHAVEGRFGLRRTAPGDRTAAARPTRAESEKARRRGWREPPRVTLKREVSTAAAAASSEVEFFARLEAAGVLVRRRFSTRDPNEVTGYAVALPQDTTVAGGPVWFSGGKLAADLTLPKLRRRWADADDPQETSGARAGTFTAAERSAIWEHAARVAADAAAQIRYAAADDPAAADAAWAASDTLHAAAAALGSRVIREAATAYDRAARAPYGRIPRRTPAGTGLRRAARLLSAAAFVGHDRTLAQAALITRLAALAEAVTELRLTQQHAAQASAARSATERLRAAGGPAADGDPGVTVAPTRSANDLTRAAFPDGPQPRPTPPGAGHRTSARPGARARPRPGPARPSGPGR
jgi:MobA/VirD2-like, nuclease domain